MFFILKKWPAKGLCGRYLSKFIDWRYSQACWYFRPGFVNCCPSILLSGSTLPSPSASPHCQKLPDQELFMRIGPRSAYYTKDLKVVTNEKGDAVGEVLTIIC
jgi:hypothetical protein